MIRFFLEIILLEIFLRSYKKLVEMLNLRMLSGTNGFMLGGQICLAEVFLAFC